VSWRVFSPRASALSLSDLGGSWSESRTLCSSADPRSWSQAERIAARIVEAPTIASIGLDGSYKLDFRKVVRDDVYYSFSLGSNLFLAKRDGGVVRVFEVFRDGDGMLALPMYEVEVSKVWAKEAKKE
jgi:hypothetical protein